MKCQILFSGKNKKNISNLLSAKSAQSLIKVKKTFKIAADDIKKCIFFCYCCLKFCVNCPLLWHFR